MPQSARVLPSNFTRTHNSVILKPAGFAGRRIYGLAGSTGAAGGVHRSFGPQNPRASG